MTRVLRVHGVKYNLGRFTLPELATAADHARREIGDHERFLAALLEEQRRRARGDARPPLPHRAEPTAAA